MSLSSHNIITLMSLSGVGRTAVLCYSKYAERNDFYIHSIDDYRELISVCHQKERCRVTAENISASDLKKAELKAGMIIDKSETLGINIVGYSDKDFPQKLKNIVSKKISARGKEAIKDESPVVLYYKGEGIDRLNDVKSVAVIGTREPTYEGFQAGLYISRFIAEQGINIVGGLAIGCDTVGHTGATDVGGMTTAFLAHGLHTIYPKENERLAEIILRNGGFLISEYPIGIEPYPPYFIERDRLQSGISDATIVIQTGLSGGTMHAVNATLMNDKPLFAVEYTDERVMKQEKVLGNRKLINEGKALPITSHNIQEVVSEIIGNHISNPRYHSDLLGDKVRADSLQLLQDIVEKKEEEKDYTQLTLW